MLMNWWMSEWLKEWMHKWISRFTPLHLSCQNGHNQSCRNILITGCKPDLKNDVSNNLIILIYLCCLSNNKYIKYKGNTKRKLCLLSKYICIKYYSLLSPCFKLVICQGVQCTYIYRYVHIYRSMVYTSIYRSKNL